MIFVLNLGFESLLIYEFKVIFIYGIFVILSEIKTTRYMFDLIKTRYVYLIA